MSDVMEGGLRAQDGGVEVPLMMQSGETATKGVLQYIKILGVENSQTPQTLAIMIDYIPFNVIPKFYVPWSSQSFRMALRRGGQSNCKILTCGSLP